MEKYPEKEFSEPPKGVEPMTFQIPVGSSNHWAMGDSWWAQVRTVYADLANPARVSHSSGVRVSNRYLEDHGLDSRWGLGKFFFRVFRLENGPPLFLFEHHQPLKTKISTVTNTPFIKNSNQMASRLTETTSFPRVSFQLLQFSRQRPSFSAHRAALMTKTDLTFSAFSLRFLDFAAQFLFRCKFSFHEKRHSRQVWKWRDFPGPITTLRCA